MKASLNEMVFYNTSVNDTIAVKLGNSPKPGFRKGLIEECLVLDIREKAHGTTMLVKRGSTIAVAYFNMFIDLVDSIDLVEIGSEYASCIESAKRFLKWN